MFVNEAVIAIKLVSRENCPNLFLKKVLVAFLGHLIFHLFIVFTNCSPGDFYLPFIFALGATFRR